MMTGITNRADLEQFLLTAGRDGGPALPRQKIRIVFSDRAGAQVAGRLADFIGDGLFELDSLTTAQLRTIGWRGGFADGEARSVEVHLANGFRQPEASAIVADSLWFGVSSVGIVED